MISMIRCNFLHSLKKVGGFRATVNVLKFKVALNPLHIIFLTFVIKAQMKGVLAGHIVAMVT